MEPTTLVYEIARHYADDHKAVSPAFYNYVHGLIRARDLQGLATCTCNFDWLLHTVDDWRFLRQIEAFFKKNATFGGDEECAITARNTFMQAERQCSLTNRRLKPFIGFPDRLPDGIRESVLKARTFIANVLGDTNRFIDQLPRLIKVTPGATATRSRRNSLPQLKMSMRTWAPRTAEPYIRAVYHSFGFDTVRVRRTYTNRVEFVPKNYKTHRTIACEPDGTLPLQLAFDGWAKRKLRRFKIDLSDQSRNPRMAEEASITDNMVTVDFKAASDTIAYNVVSLLFPVDWFRFLDDIRSPMYRGTVGEGIYAKFSSMGNGATFTIETLIFAACCYAVGSRDFSVYGDDVIIGKEEYAAFLQLADFLGFTVNVDKTFSSGPFRESCGGDYFNGVNVTPVYLRGPAKRKAEWCHLVNVLAPLSYPGGHLAAFLLKLIDERNLPYVPWNQSTLSGVWIDPDQARSARIITRLVTDGIRKRKLTKIGHLLRWPKQWVISLAFRKLSIVDSQIDYYKAYVPASKQREFVDSRGYYLWFLNKLRQVSYAGPWGFKNVASEVTSSVPVFEHRYVRKRVVWARPNEGIPSHLHWWSGLVVRAS
jgi:hypothetical protein